MGSTCHESPEITRHYPSSFQKSSLKYFRRAIASQCHDERFPPFGNQLLAKFPRSHHIAGGRDPDE